MFKMEHQAVLLIQQHQETIRLTLWPLHREMCILTQVFIPMLSEVETETKHLNMLHPQLLIQQM